MDSLGDASLVRGMPPRSGASHAPRTRAKPASARSSRSPRGVFAPEPRIHRWRSTRVSWSVRKEDVTCEAVHSRLSRF